MALTLLMTYAFDATITFGGSPTGVIAPPKAKKNIISLTLLCAENTSTYRRLNKLSSPLESVRDLTASLHTSEL